MGSRLQMLGILIQIAFRNLFASRIKTLIVGGIIGFGAIVVVVGASLVDSINSNMERAIIGSATGHLQVYNANSKDELSLYGGMQGDPDLEPIDNFARIKKILLKVPNIKMVVPQGAAEAMASSGNELDITLEKLRNIARKQHSGEKFSSEEYESLKDHMRQMIALMQRDLSNVEDIGERVFDPKSIDDLKRAASQEFWSGYDENPFDNLEFLENKIAPLSVDGDYIWVRYIGTDLDAYSQAFPGMQIIQGQAVPKGQRGILFGKKYYEEWIKLKTAMRLDKIREARNVNHKTIANDQDLQRMVKENKEQIREIIIQLDSVKRQQMVTRLQKALASSESDISKLLTELFTIDDQNFDKNYQIFYSEVAPLVRLYQVKPGDTLTIRAFTKSGYFKSVNVRLYGIYQFSGLENSGLGGFLSLMDLMTFRDLYGYLTADNLAEIKQLKKEAGLRAVKREHAEDELFGSATDTPTVATPVMQAKADEVGFDEFAHFDPTEGAKAASSADRVYTKEEIEQGVAINAAIILNNPRLASQTKNDIESAFQREGLLPNQDPKTAGETKSLKLKVVSWQNAAGMVGQLIMVLSGVLVTLVLIIFVVAIIIINNSMVMATLQRIREIGTLRAIGAQRRFIMMMIGVESIVVGIFFGIIGSGVGAALVGLLGKVGIPAPSEEAQIFFAGPRLHPELSGINLVIALTIVLAVCIISGFYPAFLATRVTPQKAMQSEE